jgi:hypothetical protein
MWRPMMQLSGSNWCTATAGYGASNGFDDAGGYGVGKPDTEQHHGAHAAAPQAAQHGPVRRSASRQGRKLCFLPSERAARRGGAQAAQAADMVQAGLACTRLLPGARHASHRLFQCVSKCRERLPAMPSSGRLGSSSATGACCRAGAEPGGRCAQHGLYGQPGGRGAQAHSGHNAQARQVGPCAQT